MTGICDRRRVASATVDVPVCARRRLAYITAYDRRIFPYPSSAFFGSV